jgi:hypothetical protein
MGWLLCTYGFVFGFDKGVFYMSRAAGGFIK